MILAWRIVSAAYQESAFTGDGAKTYGGRWNSKGVPVIYTAESLALASIEILVNLSSAKLLDNYVKIPVHFEENLVQALPFKDLPSDWNNRPVSQSTQILGDKWFKEQRSAVLRVPSVVVPEEYVYLLNPVHPDFTKIEIGTPVAYHFDTRLIKKDDQRRVLVRPR
ncbi:MAG: RES family NAD+ phosphorylase [Desulfatiglans sp.]|jgi:RES domain-containing protein|nr:RES family NAD+ phosphorylase [Desulfatiglans sp.]